MPSGRCGLEDWLRVTEFPAVAIKTLPNDRICFVFLCFDAVSDLLQIFWSFFTQWATQVSCCNTGRLVHGSLICYSDFLSTKKSLSLNVLLCRKLIGNHPAFDWQTIYKICSCYMPSDCIVFWGKVLENTWRRKFAVSLTLTQGLREEKYLKLQKGVEMWSRVGMDAATHFWS